MLTTRYDRKKGTFNVTGNTSEGLEVGDTINYLVNEKYDILEVKEVTERRDDKSFPKGNNLWYSCVCKVVPNTNEELVKKLKDAKAKEPKK
jgi:2,3-bisphosphoglycerate-independent phosphoglycerate mutase